MLHNANNEIIENNGLQTLRDLFEGRDLPIGKCCSKYKYEQNGNDKKLTITTGKKMSITLKITRFDSLAVLCITY